MMQAPICNEQDWISQNNTNEIKSFYISTYPFLSKFPYSKRELLQFYNEDMSNRNLTPLVEFQNCYEFLWSYALENLPKVNDPNRFKGKTFWGYTIQNFPLAFNKTFNDIGNVIGISTKYIIIGLIFILLIMIVK